MTTALLRDELHTIIDTLPERSLPAIKPILFFLANDYWKPVIEVASPEEEYLIEERMKDYENDPASFSLLK